jgi:CheY-like chemotaxis protein
MVAEMESEEAAILLVEDDELVRETVNEVLIADGLRVTMAATGPAGLDRIKDTEFDLVVTDIALPGGLDGVRMMQRARALRPGLRCVFMSGGQPPSDSDRRLDEFVAKPFRLAELLRSVRNMLSGRGAGRSVAPA